MGYFRNDKLVIFAGNLHENSAETIEKSDLLVLMKL